MICGRAPLQITAEQHLIRRFILKLSNTSLQFVKHLPNNYRPISVISVVAKVFERIVYDQLYAYLEEHSIICKYQSGFCSTHSTVAALLEATDTLAYNIDRGKINAVVFLDLKKAFDTVDLLSTTAYVEMRITGLSLT